MVLCLSVLLDGEYCVAGEITVTGSGIHTKELWCNQKKQSQKRELQPACLIVCQIASSTAVASTLVFGHTRGATGAQSCRAWIHLRTEEQRTTQEDIVVNLSQDRMGWRETACVQRHRYIYMYVSKSRMSMTSLAFRYLIVVV